MDLGMWAVPHPLMAFTVLRAGMSQSCGYTRIGPCAFVFCINVKLLSSFSNDVIVGSRMNSEITLN